MIIFRFGEIKNHPNYVVTDEGEVYRKEKYGYHKLKPDWSNGYARVDLDGKKEYVGNLLLDAFDPTDNPNYKVFYIDGDKTNIRLENLVWLSPSDIQLYSQYRIEYRMQILGRW